MIRTEEAQITTVAESISVDNFHVRNDGMIDCRFGLDCHNWNKFAHFAF